jgi:HD-like signal output (HDOD) protein
MIGGEGLPVFPSVIARATERISDPESDMAEVSDLVATDPGLTVRLLRLVNSPAVAPRSPIETVHQATVLLGRNQLEAMLMAAGVNAVLPKTPAVGFDPPSFWLTAAMRAAAAGEIAGTLAPARRSEYFTAALLQDMAQPVLFHSNSDYADVVSAWDGSHLGLTEREADELGWTHAEVGSLMCRHWELPEFLTDAVTLHHERPEADYGIVQWATMVEGDGERLVEARDAAHDLFGVGHEEAEQMLDRATERAAEVAAVFT